MDAITSSRQPQKLLRLEFTCGCWFEGDARAINDLGIPLCYGSIHCPRHDEAVGRVTTKDCEPGQILVMLPLNHAPWVR